MVNAVIIPQNWGAIPFFGASPLRRYCPPILWNDDRIHQYILPRTTVFPQSGSTEFLKTSNLTLKRKQFFTPREGNPGNVLLTSRICLKYFYQWTITF